MARRRKRSRGLGFSAGEHEKRMLVKMEMAEDFADRADRATDCVTKLRIYRDTWEMAGKAFGHLESAGGISQSSERAYNRMTRKLDRLTENIEKSCLRRSRKKR